MITRYPCLACATLPLVAGLGLWLAGCSSPEPSETEAENRAPRIRALSASSLKVGAGDVVKLEVWAEDPDLDPLTFAWSAPAGQFSVPTEANTEWVAPASGGTVDIACQVSDEEGLFASLALTVTVMIPAGDQDGDGISLDQGDCNDQDAASYPGATELGDGRDNDCDGEVDEGLGQDDLDEDGYSPLEGDCDDANSAVHPQAPEPVDGQDNDCDGVADEGSDEADDDGDGLSEAEGDCDDGVLDVYPGALEAPDGRDNDCDGTVDEGTSRVDDDGDGLSEQEADCDDEEASVYPGAVEAENGADDDCDGQVDEGTPSQDLDGDGFTVGEHDCQDDAAAAYPGALEVPDGIDNDCDGRVDEHTAVTDDDGDGLSEAQGDCDDDNANNVPGGIEYPDGLDNDCDGEVDEATSARDDDLDGFSENDGDCDDTDPRARPTYPEVPDGQDNDCDGAVDEGTSLADEDEDGYQVSEGDCDDHDASTWPGAIDVPGDGIDNDCSSETLNAAPLAGWKVVGATNGCGAFLLDASSSHDPEGKSLQYRWYMVDAPLEGSLAQASSVQASLVLPSQGSYRVGLSVSDGSLTGVEEVQLLDGLSLRYQFCDFDGDGDGVTINSGDCDDTDPEIYPGKQEVCDGIDQDCDGEEVLIREEFDRLDATRWALYGTAVLGEGDVVLTPAEPNKAGSIFLGSLQDVTRFSIAFEVLIEGGSSGAGLAFAVLDPDAQAFLGAAGGGMGLRGLSGWGVELDTTYDEGLDATRSDHLAFVNAADQVASGPTPRAFLRSDVYLFEVAVDGAHVIVKQNSNVMLEGDLPWTLSSEGYLGFTAGTSTETDRHHVQRVELRCE